MKSFFYITTYLDIGCPCAFITLHHRRASRTTYDQFDQTLSLQWLQEFDDFLYSSLLASLADPVHDVPLLVTILGKALAALSAFMRPLFVVHKNMVLAV